MRATVIVAFQKRVIAARSGHVDLMGVGEIWPLDGKSVSTGLPVSTVTARFRFSPFTTETYSVALPSLSESKNSYSMFKSVNIDWELAHENHSAFEYFSMK